MNNEKLDKVKEDIKQKQISTIKKAVERTLTLLDDFDKEKSVWQYRAKVLKHDLMDLKDGRLDRILERQQLDPVAKEVSILCVEKVETQGTAQSPWYEEYSISVKCDDGIIDSKVNNSITKLHASGAYKMKDGSIRYL